jgi:hypothetical protein
MNLKELYEGATPKLPGAAKGIQIMTPQQFIAKSAQGQEPGSEVDEGMIGAIAGGALGAYAGKTPAAAMTGASMGSEVQDLLSNRGAMGVAEDKAKQCPPATQNITLNLKNRQKAINDYGYGPLNPDLPNRKFWMAKVEEWNLDSPQEAKSSLCGNCAAFDQREDTLDCIAQGIGSDQGAEDPTIDAGDLGYCRFLKFKCASRRTCDAWVTGGPLVDKQGVAEATALPASTRELKGQELTDYLDRIRNQDKKKTDKYNLPYVHRSSVVGYYNAEGKKYDTDAIKKGLAQKPEKLLKKNEKMKHSDGAQEQFFNIGFAALVGIALDENTNELIVVNTCPGAGSCKVDCFAMKGGKVQFAGPWLSDGRILTYLLNHPGEFFNQLTQEISKEVAKGKKGGYSVSIRWHDAGDFFSPEYMDMAFKLAQSLPGVRFYAYTKVAAAAMAGKPANFIINWSEGASTSQEKQIKRNDPNLDKTKNSRIVPSSLFYDLLVKDSKKNLVKGPEGQWQVIPDELPELKQRLADKYNISKNSILSYDEWNTKGKNNKSMKWNVIVAPGEPDLTANDPGVLGTLLLKH